MKSESRVHPAYKKGTPDWQAEYNMLLEDGVTCADCAHVRRCCTLFGQKPEQTACQFHTNRFQVRRADPMPQVPMCCPICGGSGHIGDCEGD